MFRFLFGEKGLLEPAREFGKLPQQRLGKTLMPCIIGMEQIFGVVIIDRAMNEWEETRERVGIDHWDSPHIASLLDTLHISILIQSATTLDILLRLEVLVTGIEDSAMDRSEQYDLLIGIIFLDKSHRPIDTTPECVGIIGEPTIMTQFLPFHLSISSLHNGVAFFIPLTDPHPMIIVIGTHQYKDSIHIRTMLLVELLHLCRNMRPLLSTDPIDIRLNVKPLTQESPVFLLGSTVTRICLRVSQEGHTRTVPRMHLGKHLT